MSDKSWEPGMSQCFNVLTLTLSHSLSLTLSHSHTLSMSHSLTLDMLNNFCFHVYAQKSVFIGQIVNVFFFTSSSAACEFRGHRAGSQLKIFSSPMPKNQ